MSATHTTFDAAKHGFRFVNSFSLGPFRLGLCGGMCFAALDRWYAGVKAPTRIVPPNRGTPLWRELVRRQLDSFHGLKVPFMAWSWQRKTDEALYSCTRWWELLLASNAIKAGHPAVLCLIRAKRGESPTRNHQVVATGIVKDDLGIVVKVYDPNRPFVANELWIGDDGRMRQLTGEPLRGFFVIGYQAE